ncbi:response regulator [Desulfovibrio sp. TomC]|uniref:response regulator n=1 Tax=Desulfovibrio sp. TomC TaxID=1562888 RepID=UPI0005759008|nr:response regulator [Desulfovibrio sp. TomC]KHK03772.1 response regulator [Desulfovibrio sp. TomC]
MKILIVDDDPLSRLTLEATLSRFGPCLCAENGSEGLDLYTRALDAGEPFSVVFMDIQMPIMDGHTALTAIRALEKERGLPPGREAKAVMITCHDDVKNVATSFFRGNVTCYFTKPLNLAAMVETLKKEAVL